MDLGPELIEHVRAQMQVDREWSVDEDRGFTWWGSWIRQRVWADPVVESLRIPITRVHAETRIARGIHPSDAVVELIAAANGLASLSAMVFDPNDGTVSARCALAFHPQIRGWLEKVLWSAVALQVAVASDRKNAEAVATAMGGEVDDEPHPSGSRRERDDMLNVLALYQVRGQVPLEYGRRDFERVARATEEMGLDATVGGEGLDVPIGPAGGDTSPAMLRVEPTVHPGFGHGLFSQLRLDAAVEPGELARQANELNLQASRRKEGHLLGAWTHRDGRLHHVSFLPALIVERDDRYARQARLTNLVFEGVTNAKTALETLADLRLAGGAH